ncbi:MAG: hypothetical protein K9N46_05395 [Candidatus Marinimicrobia bacterium]|nr:hypothetical protein [Candidatus Neomarinimicrobiota bacterium]MCF7880157.1 hypothetical protein [Candidatus Neomarinimicrobiota bacterium]
MDSHSVHYLTLEEFKKQGRETYGDRLRWAFVCPHCQTIQTAMDFKELAGLDDKTINDVVGNTCIGYYIEDRGCDFQLKQRPQSHEVVLIFGGVTLICFRLATAEEYEKYLTAHEKQTEDRTT